MANLNSSRALTLANCMGSLQHEPSFSAPIMPGTSFPVQMVQKIAAFYLENPRDLLNLGLASKWFFKAVIINLPAQIDGVPIPDKMVVFQAKLGKIFFYYFDFVASSQFSKTLPSMVRQFLEACRDGDIEKVKLGLSNGVNPSVENNLAIVLASRSGHTEIVRYLLQDKRLNSSEIISGMALYGLTAALKVVLASKSIDPAVNENQPMRWAAFEGHVDTVELLLKDPRVNPAAKDNQALRWASERGHGDVVNVLLRDPRVYSARMSALNIALGYDRFGVVKVLLEDWKIDTDSVGGMPYTSSKVTPLTMVTKHPSFGTLSAINSVLASSVQLQNDEFLFCEKVKFLQKNFCFFDPITLKTSEVTPEALRRARIILMGESHYSTILPEIQGQFLKLFASENSCLLVESLAISEKLSIQELNKLGCVPFRNLPQRFTILGSDVRSRTFSAKGYYEFLLSLEAKKAINSKFEKLMTKVSKTLNNAFLTNKLVVEKDCFFFKDSSQFDIIDKAIDSYEGFAHKILETSKLKDLKEEQIEDKGEEETNRALLQEIVKASSTYRQVLCIWGKVHFFDDRFIEVLEEKLNLPVLILFPNRKNQQIALRQMGWVISQERGRRDVKLKTEKDGNVVSLNWKISVIDSELFLPQIQQAIFQQQLVQHINLVEMCRVNKTFTLPANIPLVFTNISLDNSYTVESRLSTINRLLALHFLSSTSSPSIDTERYKEVGLQDELILIFDKPITFTTEQNKMLTVPNPRTLFLSMIRQGMRSLKVLPGQSVVFEITGREKTKIEKEGCRAWIKSFSLKGFQAKITVENSGVLEYGFHVRRGGFYLFIDSTEKLEISI